jgi:hypothetical protein
MIVWWYEARHQSLQRVCVRAPSWYALLRHVVAAACSRLQMRFLRVTRCQGSWDGVFALMEGCHWQV